MPRFEVNTHYPGERRSAWFDDRGEALRYAQEQVRGDSFTTSEVAVLGRPSPFVRYWYDADSKRVRRMSGRPWRYFVDDAGRYRRRRV